MSTIAKVIGISPTVLAKLCKTHEGKTISGKLQAIRIMHARELLLATDASIEEIAYANKWIAREQLLALAAGYKTEYGEYLAYIAENM